MLAAAGWQNEKGSDLSPEPFCIIALKQAEIT
jgi:hypothetical protein